MLPLSMFFQLYWSEKSKVRGTSDPVFSATQQFYTRDLKDGQLSFVFKFTTFFFFFTKSLLCWEKDLPFFELQSVFI